MQPKLTPQADNALEDAARRLHLSVAFLKFLFVGVAAHAVNQGKPWPSIDEAPRLRPLQGENR